VAAAKLPGGSRFWHPLRLPEHKTTPPALLQGGKFFWIVFWEVRAGPATSQSQANFRYAYSVFEFASLRGVPASFGFNRDKTTAQMWRPPRREAAGNEIGNGRPLKAPCKMSSVGFRRRIVQMAAGPWPSSSSQPASPVSGWLLN